jgi:DNA-binding CsgD family transcriptional regulator
VHPRAPKWLGTVLAATSLVALKAAMNSAIGHLGFRYFIYRGHFPDSPSGSHDIQLDSTPAPWRELCSNYGMDFNWDPLHSRALREVTPILWSNVKTLHPALFGRARRLGVGTGVTQPLHGPGGQWSAVSFIKDRAGLRAERAILAALPQCQLLTTFTHDAVSRIIAQRLDVSLPPLRQASTALRLSERENECLALAALGKTMPQIARVLPISERTVAFHLANARRKLQVASLRHAVTKATSLGLIREA